MSNNLLLFSYKLFFILLCLLFFACAERGKENPFDPSGSTPLNLSVSSHGKRVDLSWNNPDLTNYIGFNIYRKEESEKSSYKLIEAVSHGTRKFSDRDVEYQKRYNYYVVVVGNGQESKPSNTVSILPGPGYNWIVDKWGFQVLKTTYDTEHIIMNYYTNYPPTDIAIAKSYDIALITYSDVGLIDIIDLSGNFIETIDQIAYPYNVMYDSTSSSFWLADSSGSLFRINAEDRNVQLVSSSLKKPMDITIAQREGTINVVDNGVRKIYQFNRNGNVINEISEVNGRSLSWPKKYLHDEFNQRIWLADSVEQQDIIYTTEAEQIEFSCVDTLFSASHFVLDKFHDSIWMINVGRNYSSVVQLSSAGLRQLVISNLDRPKDIEINPYDGTLLIVETGKRRILHFSSSQELIGSYSLLNYPLKVIIE
jgi:hypothetical protein